ncbi:MAG: hypothetical protein IH897_16835, partial [Planctomycetes bacterium]|nr:hypothetical protein [Planctomycetota bacterium]
MDNIRKDESDSSADRGSGAVTASAAPSKTEEAARPEPSRAEGENKSDSPKGDGKENTDEGGGIVVRDAKTGKAVTGFKIEKLDPNKKRVIPPNPIPQPDPNPSSIEGLKAVTTESGLKYWDIKVGEGEVPQEQAMVKVDYRCWLADGAMADSAWQQRWYPTYQKPGVIAGLAESIWSMREG